MADTPDKPPIVTEPVPVVVIDHEIVVDGLGMPSLSPHAALATAANLISAVDQLGCEK